MKTKFRILIAIILTVIISMPFANVRSTSGFSIDYISSDVVEYGNVLTVQGSGVTAGSTVNLYWDYVTAANLLNTTEGKPDGTFECEIMVPSDIIGDHYLWAKDLATGICACARIEMVSAPPPPMPHTFYGDVTIGEEPAPVGTIVEAKIRGVTYATTVLSEEGFYLLFIVLDSGLEDGDTVDFYVDGVWAAKDIFWSASVTILDLIVLQIVEYDIELFEGWNLIGIPFAPEDPSIGVVLADILDNLSIVYAFCAETKTWSSYLPVIPEVADLTEMVEDQGYWIYMKTNDVLTVRARALARAEGIVTEVDSEPGTNCFVYSTDEYQIAVKVPTYLEISTPYNKSASEVDVYLKPLVSLSGLFSVDFETGIKFKIPAFSIWAFSDVDITIFGEKEYDIYEFEWRIFGLSTALDMEEGDVGIYALSIPTMAGAVSLEDLPIGEWSYVASYDVYTVMESTTTSLGLTVDDVTIGSVTSLEQIPQGEVDIEVDLYNFVGSINSDVYHKPTCHYVDSIHDHNKIYFLSAEEAELAGYRPCTVCNP